MLRRDCLKILAGLGLAACLSSARAGERLRLWAAWDSPEGRHYVGLLDLGGTRVTALAELETPTRAHGLVDGDDGSVYVLARRPGEWMLHWAPRQGAAQWFWQDGDRRFSGHALRVADRLFTVESEQEDGRGMVVARRPDTQAELAAWPTHGTDPHELLWHQGALLVANGGVPTAPETGRQKLDMSRMDSSLVRLEPVSGKRLGQWRLADPRLSIRHLALHRSGTVGIALQAEHDEAAEKAAAPTFALFDGEKLHLPPRQSSQAGYGGSIVALEGGDAAFALGCPRTGRVVVLDQRGSQLRAPELAEACALAAGPGGELLAGGREQALQLPSGGAGAGLLAAPAYRFDNHWALASA